MLKEHSGSAGRWRWGGDRAGEALLCGPEVFIDGELNVWMMGEGSSQRGRQSLHGLPV